jgi:hypothetical protein
MKKKRNHEEFTPVPIVVPYLLVRMMKDGLNQLALPHQKIPLAGANCQLNPHGDRGSSSTDRNTTKNDKQGLF